MKEGLSCSQQYVQVDENFFRRGIYFFPETERERKMSRQMYYALKLITEHTHSHTHTYTLFLCQDVDIKVVFVGKKMKRKPKKSFFSQ
jgi:hypothetical protein